MNHDYVQVWKNTSSRPFKLFLADIEPPNAGKVPPDDFELRPKEETTLKWTCPPPNGDGKTSGYLRFWSIPSTEHKLGSGLTFGIKLEQDFVKGVPQPYKVLTYVGSPTGDPNSWTDVTTEFNPDYNFFVRGPGMFESYGINIRKLLGPIASISITIEQLYQQATGLILPPGPDYVEEWVNETREGIFELLDSAIVVPTTEKPSKVIKPKDGSRLYPGRSAVLAWSCPIPEGSGYTVGSLRYWADKTAAEGHVFGVRLEQMFAASTAAGKESTPEPPQVMIFNGPPFSFLWEDVTKELMLNNSYTFKVKHNPVDYIVTVENLMSIHFSRCAVRVTITDGMC
ncbi:hypothetical protein CALCODRAFT_481086 [Calocera cornea HHB12733]|uniref:Uncharacterized protein n=1 Tax=Calocera cornea HHB12733 TaxID=1353952 RepID=A0A165I183_9BASI|nr:hypothetical protein CALCODRAFT_481086 [Calocera cornea HHB12733]